ncbi:MAG: hypothetical protein JKX72_09525 [Robiginitomaculum sp.]|nr:hypothetical protein [Robiginitomaculum sp.]
MKRFQVVIDLSKQLISIAVGLIGGSVALSSNIFSELNQLRVFLPFIFALLCWGISIALGVFNIGATVNQIEQQEKCDYKNNKTKKKKHLEFVSILIVLRVPNYPCCNKFCLSLVW